MVMDTAIRFLMASRASSMSGFGDKRALLSGYGVVDKGSAFAIRGADVEVRVGVAAACIHDFNGLRIFPGAKENKIQSFEGQSREDNKARKSVPRAKNQFPAYEEK